MKRVILALVGIILISNSIWGYLYFNKEDDTASNANVQVYTLNGTGATWDVKDYKIIISPSKIFRGHGKLIYKGDSNDLTNSTYFKYDINERNFNNNVATVLGSEASSLDGPLSILKNTTIGSITNPYSYGELSKDRQTYENSTVTITWNDNEGINYSEIIHLDIDSEISLNDDL